MSRALVVVDVQNDFCEGGSLAVEGGARVAAGIGELLAAHVEDPATYAVVVATRDHHIDPGEHFAAPGTEPDFATTWPVHCEVGTAGEEFHPALQPRPFDAVFLKGEHEAAYSGFEGTCEDGSALADWLRARAVDEVDVCGLATDFCVRSTALDAAREGFRTRLLQDLVAGVAPRTTRAALVELTASGVELI